MNAQQRADIMAGTVWNTLYGPTGVAPRLPQRERELLVGTLIVVVDSPTTQQRAMVGAKPTDRLLGLYTAGPSEGDAVVHLFANEITAVGYDPGDVVIHELGHVFHYNHATRIASVSNGSGGLDAVCTDCSPRAGSGATCSSCAHRAAVTVAGTMTPAAHQVGFHDNCDVCLTWDHANRANGLLYGLRERAHLQHQIPLGLGGTIPLARAAVQRSQKHLQGAALNPSLIERQGDIRSLDGMLSNLDAQLSGWLTPEDVSVAAALSHRATDLAYDLNHVHWLKVKHGSAY